MTDDSTTNLARFVAKMPGEAIPETVLRRATDAMIDTVGVTLAGSASEVVKLLMTALDACAEPAPGRQILGTTRVASLLDAIYVNSVASHAMDFDDMFTTLRCHPSSHLVPALLAVGADRQLPGRQVMECYIAGLLVESLLARALNPAHYDSGWHATTTIGTLSTSAAVARAIGLDADGIAAALGCAAALAGGLRASLGTAMNGLQVGNAARTGTLAALLAASGADSGGLAHHYGFLALFGQGKPTVEALERELASQDPTDWSWLDRLALKPYPCCGEVGPAVEAAIAISDRVMPDDIEAITVETNESGRRLLTVDVPANADQARFSGKYCVTSALISGRLTPEEFAEERIEDSRIREIVSASSLNFSSANTGGTVVVRRRSGAPLVSSVPDRLGFADRWMTAEQLRAKFRSCAEYAGIAKADELFRRIDAIWSSPSVVGLLAASPRSSTLEDDYRLNS